MRITLPLILICISFTNFINGQAAIECEETCIVDKVVYETAYLGVRLNGICESYHDEGVRIKEVIEDTPGAINDLQVGDIILRVDGVEVNRRKEVIDDIVSRQPFSDVTLIIQREGVMLSKTITLAARTTKTIQVEVCCEDIVSSLAKENIKLYPNPASTMLNVSFNKIVDGEYDFEIYMTNGVRVDRYKKTLDKEESTEQINISKLEDGMYVLKITKDDITFSELFVVKSF